MLVAQLRLYVCRHLPPRSCGPLEQVLQCHLGRQPIESVRRRWHPHLPTVSAGNRSSRARQGLFRPYYIGFSIGGGQSRGQAVKPVLSIVASLASSATTSSTRCCHDAVMARYFRLGTKQTVTSLCDITHVGQIRSRTRSYTSARSSRS